MVAIAKNIIIYIHRDVHIKHTKYINVHSLTHTHISTQGTHLPEKNLFFKTPFLKSNYYKLQSGKGPLFAWRGMKGLHSTSRQAFNLIYTPLYIHVYTQSTHRHNSSTTGSEVFTPNPQAVHRKTQFACAYT